mmetsp:Transcript_34164/g.98387  ORF Transcript_34164/g.98387 Transcript_34164/m.98387 type:complete len:86 (+) Transcript_34164:994-1251(+)
MTDRLIQTNHRVSDVAKEINQARTACHHPPSLQRLNRSREDSATPFTQGRPLTRDRQVQQKPSDHAAKSGIKGGSLSQWAANTQS